MEKIKFKKTRLLMSVVNEHEVFIVKDFADIIDLKNPEDGPLGCLKINDIKNIVNRFSQKLVFSATLGNKMEFNKIISKIKKFDELGLDYIKIGFFWNSVRKFTEFLNVLSYLSIRAKIVVVIFAENTMLLKKIKKNMKDFLKYGISHFLIDTEKKESMSLTEIYDYASLNDIVLTAKYHGITIGLAGKIRLGQLNKVLQINPHIIGLRGALCLNDVRNEKIAKKKVVSVYEKFCSFNRKAQAAAGA